MRVLFASLLLVFPILANEQTLAKIQAFYDKTTSFKADFKQIYRNKLFSRTDQSQGTVSYQKPGKMRWDYLKPNSKSFILNQNILWMVEPEEKIAYVNRCFKSDALTASLVFLGGKGKLAQEFKSENNTKNQIVLLPKTPNDIFIKLVLSFDSKTYQITKSILIDTDGNQNEFEFEKRRFNHKIKSLEFAFHKPKEFELLDMPGGCGR